MVWLFWYFVSKFNHIEMLTICSISCKDSAKVFLSSKICLELDVSIILFCVVLALSSRLLSCIRHILQHPVAGKGRPPLSIRVTVSWNHPQMLFSTDLVWAESGTGVIKWMIHSEGMEALRSGHFILSFWQSSHGLLPIGVHVDNIYHCGIIFVCLHRASFSLSMM